MILLVDAVRHRDVFRGVDHQARVAAKNGAVVDLDVFTAVEMDHRAAGRAAEHKIAQLHMPHATRSQNIAAESNRDDERYAAFVGKTVTNPANGTLSGTAPNLTYTPAANFNGSDSFTFKVNDGSLTSVVATVLITVIS